jgi:hypothetical protein
MEAFGAFDGSSNLPRATNTCTREWFAADVNPFYGASEV